MLIIYLSEMSRVNVVVTLCMDENGARVCGNLRLIGMSHNAKPLVGESFCQNRSSYHHQVAARAVRQPY